MRRARARAVDGGRTDGRPASTGVLDDGARHGTSRTAIVSSDDASPSSNATPIGPRSLKAALPTCVHGSRSGAFAVVDDDVDAVVKASLSAAQRLHGMVGVLPPPCTHRIPGATVELVILPPPGGEWGTERRQAKVRTPVCAHARVHARTHAATHEQMNALGAPDLLRQHERQVHRALQHHAVQPGHREDVSARGGSVGCGCEVVPVQYVQTTPQHAQTPITQSRHARTLTRNDDERDDDQTTSTTASTTTAATTTTHWAQVDLTSSTPRPQTNSPWASTTPSNGGALHCSASAGPTS
jgi:hypothetical protein